MISVFILAQYFCRSGSSDAFSQYFFAVSIGRFENPSIMSLEVWTSTANEIAIPQHGSVAWNDIDSIRVVKVHGDGKRTLFYIAWNFSE